MGYKGMITTIKNILIMGSLVTLAACGGGGGGDSGDGGETPPPPVTNYSVKTATDGTIDLQTSQLQGSINTACYTNNSNCRIDTVSISGLTWTYKEHTYPGDTSCQFSPITQTAIATLTVGNNSTIAAWTGTGVTPPASAADPDIDLAGAAYTIINGTITDSTITGIDVDFQFSSGYVIDDSSADGVVLYRVTNTLTDEATINDPFTSIPSPTIGSNLEINITSIKNTNLTTTEIAYTVKNTGDTATSASTFHVMGWADRATAPAYGVTSSNNFGIGPTGAGHGIIAAGGSENGMVTVYNTAVTPGDSLNAYLIADIYNSEAESDEGLTGVNDNLSHMPWIPSDIFIYRNTDFSDKDTTITITATYSTADNKTALRFNDSANGYTFIIYLNGEIAAGTYDLTDFTSDGSVNDVIDFSPTETYSLMPWEPVNPQGAQITITSAGAVGELITGTYGANLCKDNLSQTCTTTKVYTGSFSMVRDPDQ